MDKDLLGGTGGTSLEYKRMMAKLIVDPDIPEWGIQYASPTAVERWTVHRIACTLKCERCETPLFFPNGAPVRQENIAPGMRALCDDCRRSGLEGRS